MNKCKRCNNQKADDRKKYCSKCLDEIAKEKEHDRMINLTFINKGIDSAYGPPIDYREDDEPIF